MGWRVAGQPGYSKDLRSVDGNQQPLVVSPLRTILDILAPYGQTLQILALNSVKLAQPGTNMDKL